MKLSAQRPSVRSQGDLGKDGVEWLRPLGGWPVSVISRLVDLGRTGTLRPA